MRKKSASGVLARHCRLTLSAAFTNVTRFIQRVVNLRGSTYRKGTPRLLALLRPCLGQGASLTRRGWAGKKVTFLRILQAILMPTW
jgi:hypothetical protein